MATRKPEGQTYEEKSKITWSPAGKQLDLLKTIVAFANCEGGELCILDFVGDEGRLDSAKLHDFVSKYVAPSVNGITTHKSDDGSWTISVIKSPAAPHVIKTSGFYVDNKDVQKPAFYPGQIYVRHSSKSEPATAEDLQRLIRESVATWLGSLGEAVAKVGITESGADTGIPVRLVAGGPALEISINETYPYSASDLGKPFGKPGSWIGKLINKEGMRNDPRFCRTHNMYTQPIYTFSETAKERVAEILAKDPDYNPYS